MAAPDRIVAHALALRTPALDRVAQGGQVAVFRRHGNRRAVPRTAADVEVAQCLQAAVAGGERARALVPWTPLFSPIEQAVEVAGGCGRVAPNSRVVRMAFFVGVDALKEANVEVQARIDAKWPTNGRAVEGDAAPPAACGRHAEVHVDTGHKRECERQQFIRQVVHTVAVVVVGINGTCVSSVSVLQKKQIMPVAPLSFFFFKPPILYHAVVVDRRGALLVSFFLPGTSVLISSGDRIRVERKKIQKAPLICPAVGKEKKNKQKENPSVDKQSSTPLFLSAFGVVIAIYVRVFA